MQTRKAPRKITRQYLVNVANAYLERWSTSRSNLRRLLMRRIDRSVAHHGGARSDHEPILDEVLDMLEKLGAIDDAKYAESKVRTLVGRGASERAIRSRLAAKGVPGAVVDVAFTEEKAESGDPTLRACATYVRKRRLGPYRDASVRKEEKTKDLARLGRAGFPYGVARRVLELEDPEAVEAVSRGLE